MFGKKLDIFLFIIIIFTFLLRLYPLLLSNVITQDGIRYIETAKMFALGDFKKIKEVSFFNLYPIMIVIFQKIFKDWELSARMVSVLFGTFTVIPLFFIAKKLINLKIAYITILFFAINPNIVEYSSDVLREALFWSLFLFALWFGVEGTILQTKLKCLFLFLSALLTGLSISVRMEGVMTIFIILIWSVWLYRIGDIKIKHFLSNSAIYIFSLIVISLPFLFFLKKRLGWWEFGLLEERLYDMLLNTNEFLKHYIRLLDNAPNKIKSFIDISLRHRYSTYLFEVIYKLIKSLNVTFFTLALFGLFKRKVFSYQKGEAFFIIWFFIAFLFCYSYVAKIQYLGTRHGLLMGIPFLMWSAIGFFEFSERVKNGISRLKIPLPLLRFSTFFVLLIIIALNSYSIFSSYRCDKIELKTAGVYLKNNGFKEKNIATIPPLSRVVFYADAVPVIISEGLTDDELKKLFIDNKVDYILIDKMMFETFFYKANHIFSSPHLKRIEIPFFNNFKEYSLELYKITFE